MPILIFFSISMRCHRQRPLFSVFSNKSCKKTENLAIHRV
jgi:hypothetical protein